MIEIDGLRFTYAGASRPVLDGVTLRIGAGELVLAIGSSGSGKSTLLRCMNGLVPHFHGGAFGGQVVVAGRDTRAHPPRALATTVGMVFQDPESQIVAETVEDEIAFGLENVCLAPTPMRKRVEEALDLLGIVPLRRRRLDTLSGGELQRVAIAAAVALQPRVLLLDEPTSQLDPQAADGLIAAVQRLNDDLGITVVIAEHRLERVVQYAERVLYLPGDGSVRALDPRAAMATLPLAPPVSRVGRARGWSPLPLSVREARRFVDGAPPPAVGRNGARADGETLVRARDLSVSYDGAPALRGVSFELRAGEVLALMGRNGAGKSTLLRALVGLVELERGGALVLGRDIASTRTEDLARDVALVPQSPSAVLYHDSVSAEVRDALRAGCRVGTADGAMAEWRLEELSEAHPLDLSAGERQRAALATMLAGAPRLLLLDEPTRGMDYDTKELLVRNVRRRCDAGAAAIVATHDVELAACIATRVLLLSDGEGVIDGPVRAVLSESLTFSTQVNRLFGGDALTPEDVLGGTAWA